MSLKDNFPLPRIDVCFGAPRGNQWCSTLDLTSGYQQVDMDPQDAAITDFVSSKGLLNIIVCLFVCVTLVYHRFQNYAIYFYLDYNGTCV